MASTAFLNPIDLNKSEIQNAVFQNLATAPSSPAAGQFYYDTDTNQLGIYNGSTWDYLGTGSGTVTSVSVASANGFAGTVATSTTTPAITLTTTITGLLKGNGTAISAATAGTDYLEPDGDGSALTSLDAGNIASGTLAAARLPSLDTIAATATAAGAVTMNGQKVTNVGTPTTGTDAATKSYVDAAIEGLHQKPTATVATTAALPACTYANGTSGVGATLTASSNGALTVDSHAVAVGERVLVKDQSTAAQNGLYDVTAAGDASNPFILTRNADMDTSGEFAGAFIPVEDAGTANANSLWLCTNTADPTVGTDAIALTQLNKGTDLAAGTGITISGNTVSIDTSWAGQTAITTLGTVTTGTWNATTIAVAHGGTGATSASSARSNLGATGKYSALIGDGSSTTISITQGTHGLAANGQMVAQVFDASTGAQVFPGVSINNSNGTVSFTFTSAPASDAYRVVLIG